MTSNISISAGSRVASVSATRTALMDRSHLAEANASGLGGGIVAPTCARMTSFSPTLDSRRYSKCCPVKTCSSTTTSAPAPSA